MAPSTSLRRETGDGALRRTIEPRTGARAGTLLDALRPGLQHRYEAMLDASFDARLADLVGRLDVNKNHGSR